MIQSAPLLDVMMEQLEYLAAHSTRGCEPGCADCARFEQVMTALLVPFHSTRAVETVQERRLLRFGVRHG